MSEPHIRRATPDDALPLAELINQAGEGIPLWLWSQAAQEGQTPLDVGMERARREEGGFSYRNASVMEVDGNVAGMVLGYRQSDEMDETEECEGAPEFLKPLIVLECRAPGTFYVNALATYPEHRSKGFGSRLMAEAERLAQEQETDTLSLIAFEQNEGAVRLYKRLGFDVVDKHELIPHESFDSTGYELLMTRTL